MHYLSMYNNKVSCKVSYKFLIFSSLRVLFCSSNGLLCKYNCISQKYMLVENCDSSYESQLTEAELL